MINFITKWAGVIFCLAGYICSFIALTFCAMVTPSWGVTLMMIAIIIFITGQFYNILINNLLTIGDKKEYEYFDENGQETPALGWKDKNSFKDEC